MLTYKTSIKTIVREGYAVYGIVPKERQYKMCKWYLYPIFRTIEKLRLAKCKFYFYLNIKRIMHTPEGYEAHISDIPIIKKLQEYSLKVKRGPLKPRL